VAICLEKSGWVPAIYLAVLKAGGAFVPLSPALSVDQVSSAVKRLSPSIVISSPPNLSKFVGLVEHVLDISDVVKNHQATNVQLLPEVSVTPHDPACIIFTSDGVEGPLLVLDHAAVCASIATNSNIHDFSPTTRTLQFAPYNSSTGIADIIFTLAAGGCVCTPSGHEQLICIADACTRMKPSLACLTPSVASALNQDDLPGLDTIILAGEPLETSSVEKWASATNLINAYASAAALGYACSTAPIITISSPRNIGWPRGCAVWVMDPQDPTRLAPPGAVGQLLIESPYLGQKYESGSQPSASALVPRPKCLSLSVFSPKPVEHARCFLTEHLVRFDIRDGTLQLLGHKSSKGQLLRLDSHHGESPASSVGETMTITGPVTPMAVSASQTSLDTSAINTTLQTSDTRFELLNLPPQKLSRLEALLKPLGLVQDCYPCCPVQEGILVSQVKAPGTYNILVVWELVNGADTSLSSLRAAWERVVQRHAPLRLTFVESLRDGSVFDQVVLTSPSVDVVEVPWMEDLTEDDDMLQLTAATWNKEKPHHRLGLSKATDGRLRCQLLISHAVIDGLSVQTLGHDLERSLNGVLPASQNTDLQRLYIQQLQQAPEEDAREFWRSYLDGLSGCLLPKLTDWADQNSARVSTKRRVLPDVKRLRRFCQEQGTTLFSLTQAAWAMVLRAYTLSDDVCFAFMATDRHLLGDEADNAVGFFINLMLCRVGIEGSTPIADVLSALRRDFVSSFPYQHHPLAEIAHDQGIPASQLFNTTMTFMTDDDDTESHCDGVKLHRVADQDVAEVFHLSLLSYKLILTWL
jgi:non-ribosomal peptide synthetase component F